MAVVSVTRVEEEDRIQPKHIPQVAVVTMVISDWDESVKPIVQKDTTSFETMPTFLFNETPRIRLNKYPRPGKKE
ncbi:MAG: hypothetical protein ACOCXQ_04730 [Patescibacteria group bacterium]